MIDRAPPGESGERITRIFLVRAVFALDFIAVFDICTAERQHRGAVETVSELDHSLARRRVHGIHVSRAAGAGFGSAVDRSELLRAAQVEGYHALWSDSNPLGVWAGWLHAEGALCRELCLQGGGDSDG